MRIIVAIYKFCECECVFNVHKDTIRFSPARFGAANYNNLRINICTLPIHMSERRRRRRRCRSEQNVLKL